jgi:NAD(P)H-dependent FMN reductase
MIPSILPEGVEFEIADISKLPFYNADVEQIGLPEAVQAFRGRPRMR